MSLPITSQDLRVIQDLRLAQVPLGLQPVWRDPVTGALVDKDGKVLLLSYSNSALLVGDSLQANNNSASAGFTALQNVGAFNWFNAFANQRLRVVANAGVGGQRVTNIGGVPGLVDLLPAYLAAYESAYVVVLAGTNDITNGASAASLIAGLTQVLTLCRGRKVLISTLLPRADAGFTGAQRLIFNQVNAWIRQQQTVQYGIFVSDPFRYLAVASNATNDPLATDYYDTPALHPAPSGAMKIGEVWARDWGPFIPPAPRLSGGGADTYDNVSNLYGNMLSNGALQSLTSSGLPAGVAGSYPVGFTVQRQAGAGTWTGSAVARAASDLVDGIWYRAAITGESSASAQYQMRQNFFGPNGGNANSYAIGDTVFAEAEIKVTHTGSTKYVKGIYVTVQDLDRDGAQVIVANGPYFSGLSNPLQNAKDYTAIIRTPEFVVSGSAGSGTSNQRLTASLNVLFDGTVSAALTVDIGQISLRKVPT